MRRRTPRFTGLEHIPPKTLEKYPNWVYALDEEGKPGQDESTIRPADVQDSIDPDIGVCLTAADVEFADGSRGVALIGGDWSWDGTVDWLNEIRVLERRGQLYLFIFVGKCRQQSSKQFFAAKRHVLPMRVESRLGHAKNGKKLRFQIDKKGRVVAERRRAS